MLKRARERNGGPLTLEGVLVSFSKTQKGWVHGGDTYLTES